MDEQIGDSYPPSMYEVTETREEIKRRLGQMDIKEAATMVKEKVKKAWVADDIVQVNCYIAVRDDGVYLRPITADRRNGHPVMFHSDGIIPKESGQLSSNYEVKL